MTATAAELSDLAGARDEESLKFQSQVYNNPTRISASVRASRAGRSRMPWRRNIFRVESWS
ncbi:hypothetical protein CBOM_07535 [Ceraceosorus bombacis]|uniref:Uncharacterized protein n=1 Tax=Ceraceosorus bombacis TaxID=401625 RepID=A0A0P1BFI5_9BASI|nr:hypothetical protein CBOM_07535 [Ceraceosorus bombacis]